MLACQNPGQQPHGGPRIACIQRAPRGSESVNARPCDHDLCITVSAGLFYADAQSRQTIERAPAIRRCGIMADFASPSRQCRQNGVAVGDRFVPRKLNNSGDRTCRFDAFLRHDAILTCGLHTLPEGRIATFKDGRLRKKMGGRQLEMALVPSKSAAWRNFSQPSGVRITKYL